MTREVDLVSYLPPFMKKFKEVSAALEAENPEFVLILKAISQVLQNEFIETADEYGISRFEKMLNIQPDPINTLAERKALTLSRWLDHSTYTIQTLTNKLFFLFGDGIEIRQEPNEYRLEIVTHIKTAGFVDELKKIVKAYVPSNIQVVCRNIIECCSEHQLKVSTVGIAKTKYHFENNITDGDDYVYRTENGEVYLMIYKGISEKPKIPAEINGLPVVGIEATCFNYSTVTAVDLNNNYLKFIY